MSLPGFCINPAPKRAERELVELFRSLAVANTSDCMNRTFGTSNLQPRHAGGKLLGIALTVRTRSDDNLMVHKAIDIAQPGDVIVVDAGGSTGNAIIGEIMTSWAKKRGVAGFVIDGAIRDARYIRKSDYPVYSRGVSHRGPYKDGPGEINCILSIDGMVVRPGDIIVGDEDGLLAIDPAIARELAAEVRQVEAKEKKTLASIADGTVDRSWVDKLLKEKGVL